MENPGYNSLNNDLDDLSSDNNERLPSYSSINIIEFNELEIDIKLENYKLKKNIKNINSYGYVFFIINFIYFVFSLLNNNNNNIYSNYTIVNNDDNNDYNNTDNKKIFNFFILIYIVLFLINTIKNIIYYNFNFKYLMNNDSKLKFYRNLYRFFYYSEKFTIFIFVILFIFNNNLFINTSNIYLFYVIVIYILTNNVFDLFIQYSRRDLFLIYE